MAKLAVRRGRTPRTDSHSAKRSLGEFCRATCLCRLVVSSAGLDALPPTTGQSGNGVRRCCSVLRFRTGDLRRGPPRCGADRGANVNPNLASRMSHDYSNEPQIQNRATARPWHRAHHCLRPCSNRCRFLPSWLRRHRNTGAAKDLRPVRMVGGDVTVTARPLSRGPLTIRKKRAAIRSPARWCAHYDRNRTAWRTISA